MSSEYLHLLLNPVLTHVLPVAVLGLLVALVFRSPGSIRLALAGILVSAAAVWPTVHYGSAGVDRVKAMSYQSGIDWLDVHVWRAEHYEWVFYTVAGLALLALLAPVKWPKLRLPLALITLIAALGASVAGAYIGYAGGRVRHKELRDGEKPPSAELQAAREAVAPPAATP